jgi:excisionase family DNA binding protein
MKNCISFVASAISDMEIQVANKNRSKSKRRAAASPTRIGTPSSVSMKDGSNQAERSESDPTQEDLLEVFLNLPVDERSRRFLSVKDAAEMIGISSRTVRDWFYQAHLDGVYLRRVIRIDVRSLKKYLSEEDRKRKGIF